MNAEGGLRVVVHGRVQGVGYREWTRRTAEQLGVSGWVRNRRDGTVEAMLAGTHSALGAMVDSMRRGPPAARVEGVSTEPADSGAVRGFSIHATA